MFSGWFGIDTQPRQLAVATVDEAHSTIFLELCVVGSDTKEILCDIGCGTVII